MSRRARIRAGMMLTVGAILLAAAVVCERAGMASEPEDVVKSVAVLNFLRYSTWPGVGTGSLSVGVVGRQGFLETLRATLESKPVNGRAVRVVEVKSLTEAQGCQVLYLATEKATDIRQYVASPVVARTLTIGETDRFLDYGGAVNLFLVDGHIAFEANLETIERSGVAVSSNLLRVGQVRGRAKNPGGK